MSTLHDTNQQRLNVLNDELEQGDAHEMLDGASVFGVEVQGEARHFPVEVYQSDRTADNGFNDRYLIGPAYFEGIEVTFNGIPLRDMESLNLNPGDEVYVACRTLFAFAQSTWESDPPAAHTLHYKTGAYTPLSAEVVIIHPGDPAPVSITSPTETTNAASVHEPETRYFQCAVIQAGGTPSQNLRGNFAVRGGIEVRPAQ